MDTTLKELFPVLGMVLSTTPPVAERDRRMFGLDLQKPVLVLRANVDEWAAGLPGHVMDQIKAIVASIVDSVGRESSHVRIEVCPELPSQTIVVTSTWDCVYVSEDIEHEMDERSEGRSNSTIRFHELN